MASEFNPLEQWLGIGATEQPATYYRLLGLTDFERDPAAITRAAKARISQLRGIDPGVQQATMRTLIKTVAAVGAHLLDAEKKAAYDADLKNKHFSSQLAGSASEVAEKADRPSSSSVDDLSAGNRKIERLNDYLIVGRLGTRAGERVFKAEDQSKQRPVALKILPTKLINDDEAAARFVRVVEAAAQLSHRNLIALYGTGQDRGLYYLAMEFVDGSDLVSFLAERGPLNVQAAIDIALQIADGLNYAHKKGVVHRNIQPTNLLIDSSGTVKILGTGLCGFFKCRAGSAPAILPTRQV